MTRPTKNPQVIADRRRAAQAAAVLDLCRRPERPTVTVDRDLHNAERPLIARVDTFVSSRRLSRMAARAGNAPVAYEAGEVAERAADDLETAWDGLAGCAAAGAEPLRLADGRAS